ncbi:glycosyltransferase [Candidatus Woesearchaeota archaeon]|nr:glycosyltransferase [Candidatus Woesearchaeota archaeon]
MPVSLCMIVKDEEGYIEKCISSVKNIIDEIIIIDTGSNDKTKEIAKNLNAKIYDFEWSDDFSAARNFSISKATKDWILVLDADETISNKDLETIKNLTNNNSNEGKDNKKVVGYSFVQRTYCKKIKKLRFNYAKWDFYDESRPFLGWTYRGLTRLFHNDKRIKFCYPIHETVINLIKKINGKVKQTNIPIHHFEILKGEKFNNKKCNYYIKLLKNKIKMHPKAKFYFELAIELEKLNNGEAKKYFDKSIELNPNYKKLIA